MQCIGCSARTYGETLSNAPLSAKHCRLLASYLLNLDSGPEAVREMIVGDIDRFRDLGADRQVSVFVPGAGLFPRRFSASPAGAGVVRRLERRRRLIASAAPISACRDPRHA